MGCSVAKPGANLNLGRSASRKCLYAAGRLCGLPEDCPYCELRGQCLGRGAKGNRARRVSRVRRLLPGSLLVKHNPHLLAAIRWVDVAGRALRRTWMAHWRKQYVEVIPLAQIPKSVAPPRPPRAVRSHYRWSWGDRLARNAWWGLPQLRITIAGVPAYLANN